MHFTDKKVIAVCGHYGVGKTNVAVNLACFMAMDNYYNNDHISLIDFDIVNPYYRSSDNKGEAEKYGFELICPLYANSNVDVPGVVPDVLKVFEPDNAGIFDVGGDDSGAFALGGLSDKFKAHGYEMYCVINKYRPSIATPEDANEMIKEIEISSSLKVTAIINNSNLGDETNRKIVTDSFDYAAKVAEISGLNIAFTTVDNNVLQQFLAEETEKHKLVGIFNATKRPF